MTALFINEWWCEYLNEYLINRPYDQRQIYNSLNQVSALHCVCVMFVSCPRRQRGNYHIDWAPAPQTKAIRATFVSWMKKGMGQYGQWRMIDGPSAGKLRVTPLVPHEAKNRDRRCYTKGTRGQERRKKYVKFNSDPNFLLENSYFWTRVQFTRKSLQGRSFKTLDSGMRF